MIPSLPLIYLDMGLIDYCGTNLENLDLPTVGLLSSVRSVSLASRSEIRLSKLIVTSLSSKSTEEF